MQTYTGRQFWPLDPRPDEVDIADIVHSLSNQCRFAGHCESFYSVAQHSMIVADLVPDGDRRWALLHDAAEAYLVDLPRPIKRGSAMGEEYSRVEDRLLRVIAERFDLSWPMPESVKHADEVALATEARDLMKVPPAAWTLHGAPMRAVINPFGPRLAASEFMRQLRGVGIR